MLDPRHLLSEIARVLQIGGHCIIATQMYATGVMSAPPRYGRFPAPRVILKEL